VGAGPGDPDLLTRRAVDRLAAADLVVYDALVDPRALDFARSARRVFVGKRAGRPSVTQAFINRTLIRAARRGLKVVRLKGGDPFVFGRGGEEALALAAAGVPFEIVPGVSSAIAAPALAGIPVTHRGLASAFVVVSGHAEEAYGDVLRGLAPLSATIVVLMGLGHLNAIAALLLDRGWPPATPVAVVERAWTPDQDDWTATLAVVGSMDRIDRAGPATIVIGKVVDLATQLAENRRGRAWQSHGMTATR
jgi:uroporphyrin-III C-methyltransferase/precorrin-2 dehydrogenase/sirohydrochlorin ferrochelatase